MGVSIGLVESEAIYITKTCIASFFHLNFSSCMRKKKKKKGKISGKCLIAVMRLSKGPTMLVIIVYNRVVKITIRSFTLVTGVNIVCSQRSHVTTKHLQVTPGLNIMFANPVSMWRTSCLAVPYPVFALKPGAGSDGGRGGFEGEAEGKTLKTWVHNLPVLFGYWLGLISNTSPPPHLILVLLLFPPNI